MQSQHAEKGSQAEFRTQIQNNDPEDSCSGAA